jgi:hypothetical protein
MMVDEVEEKLGSGIGVVASISNTQYNTYNN